MATRPEGAYEHRRGGQELPEDVQDRPEQNAGYDAAVRGERGSPTETATDEQVDSLGDDPQANAQGVRIEREDRNQD